jgi:hypothetical protein
MQIAFEGFRTAVPAARANVSLVLDSSLADEAVSGQASLSVEQKDLLDVAKPSQVLITQAFYDRVAHYQPALRTFPSRAGVYEFLWTNEQRLNELQAEVELAPALIQPPPAPSNTFDDTVVVPVIKTLPPEPRWKAPDPAPAPLPVLDVDDPRPPRRLSTAKILAMGGVVAILLVIALVYAGGLGTSTNRVPESSRAVQQPVVPASAPPRHDPDPPVTSTPAGANNTNLAPHPPKLQKPPVVAVDHPPAVQPPAPKPARGRNCSLDDGEIPSYLNLADRYRNSGKYDRAISNYNLVLGCQPGNRQAQAGLRTAEEMEKYSH